MFIDRDPVAFNHMINYLRSNRKSMPRDLSADEKKNLENEIKFWKVGDVPQPRSPHRLAALDAEKSDSDAST